MATREIQRHAFKSPHTGEAFKVEVDQDEVSLFWERDRGPGVIGNSKCLLADVPKSEVILLLKEMIEKLEGGE